MDSPKISVIVPVYNSCTYLTICLDSLLAQTEKSWEAILIDGGSTDGSADICDAYAAKDSRIRVLHKHNEGISAARNAGLEVARGEWIAFLDSDDFIEPQMYARLLARQVETGCNAVFCGYRRVFQDHTQDEPLFDRVYSGEQVRDFAEEIFNTRIFGAIWRSIYARAAIGQLRFDVTQKYAEDLLFNLEVLKNVNGVATVADVLYNYNRVNVNSICNQTVEDPDFRYAALLQKQLKLNEYWNFPIDPNDFYMVYVDMMFQFLVRKLDEGGNEEMVTRYLTEGFFSTVCRYDKNIPLRRRIICILIRRRHYRLAVLVRKLEDLVLKLLRR